MQRQGWVVEQVSFVAGAWSLNEEELKKNLEYFKVPSGIIEPIRTKLITMKIFDEYANILKGMYSIRFNGRSDHGGVSDRPANGRSDQRDTPVRPALGTTSPLSTLSQTGRLTKLGNTRRERKGRGIINDCFMSRILLAFR